MVGVLRDANASRNGARRAPPAVEVLGLGELS
jgi:hypothetical protein